MSRRLAFLLGFAGLAGVLGLVGYVLGAELALWKAQRYVDQVAITDPRQPRGVQLTTALLFAWPALAAGLACAIRRWRHGDDPTVRAALGYFAILVLVIGGMHVARWLFFPLPTAGEIHPIRPIRPMLSLTTFAPGALDAQLAALASVVLWLYVGVRRR